ncbi:MAG TPA: hypothetical protein EYN42_00520 [Candidatus Poseidoniales archaeon]|nr:hypothetical protein [Candidatus Poseidoniales archaeon]
MEYLRGSEYHLHSSHLDANCFIVTFGNSNIQVSDLVQRECELFFQSGEIIIPALSVLEKQTPDFQKTVEADGCFIAGVLDEKAETLQLCTDPFGLHPLYYAVNNQKFLFSSSVDALIRFGELSLSLDPVGISQFLHFHYYLGEHTFCNEVKRFPQGKLLNYSLRKNDLHWTTYYHWKVDQDINNSAQAVQLLKSRFLESSSERVVDDENLICLLSGGFDSRLIVANLLELGMSFPTHTTYSDNGCLKDPVGAKLVAAELGVSNQYHELSDKYLETYWRDKSKRINFETTMHTWLMPISEQLPHGALNLDGLGGDTLVKLPNNLHVDSLDLIEQKNWSEIKNRMFEWCAPPGEGIGRIINKNYREEWANGLWNSYESEFDNIEYGPNAPSIFILKNRTRRGIACSPTLLLTNNGMRNSMPFMDQKFVDIALRINNRLRFGGEIYQRLLADVAPSLANVPTSHDINWPSEHEIGPVVRFWISSVEPLRSYLDAIDNAPLFFKSYLNLDWYEMASIAMDEGPKERGLFIREAQALGEMCNAISEYEIYFTQ